MLKESVMIVYYSQTGNTERMANVIGETMRSKSIEVKTRKVEEFDMSFLTQFDAIVIGSPTYFSNIAWPIKKMIDESIMYYYRGKQLKGKIAGIFTSASRRRDGLKCLKMLEIAFGRHHEMRVIKGIIRVKGESDREVEKKCIEYGRRLVEAIRFGTSRWGLEYFFMRPP